jgi:hypothetical protein
MSHKEANLITKPAWTSRTPPQKRNMTTPSHTRGTLPACPHPARERYAMTPVKSPRTPHSPSRWVGPTVGISLFAVMLHFAYTLLTGPWPNGWSLIYRICTVPGVMVGIWVGIQLIRRRPKAFSAGMAVTGMMTVVLLGVTLFSLFAPHYSRRITLTTALVAVVSAVLSWLLWRDWRRT